MDFSFSLELRFFRHFPKLESPWGLSDQPPPASVAAARSAGRCPKPHTFHRFWAAGSSHTRTDRAGSPINSPFHSRVKNGDSCSPAGTPSSAPAPPGAVAAGGGAPVLPRCRPPPARLPAASAGTHGGVGRLRPRPPRRSCPGRGLRPGRAHGAADAAPPPTPPPPRRLPLLAAPRRPGTRPRRLRPPPRRGLGQPASPPLAAGAPGSGVRPAGRAGPAALHLPAAARVRTHSA